MSKLSLDEVFIKKCELAMMKLEFFNHSLINDFKEVNNPEWNFGIEILFLSSFKK